MSIQLNALMIEKSDFILFEDDVAVVIFNESAIALGHLRIFPKEKVETLDKLSSDVSKHLFLIASKCATLLFEGLKCHGTNIVVKDGVNAQNQYDRVCIEAIARFQDDGLDMLWQPKQGDQQKIKAVGDQIRAAIIIGEPKITPNVIVKPTLEKPTTTQSSDAQFWENHLRRIP